MIFFVAALSLLYRDAKERTIQDLNTSQKIHAMQASRGIQDQMSSIISTLNFFANLPEIIDLDGKGKDALDKYRIMHPQEIKGITRVDEQGRIIFTTPFDPAVIGRDISSQEHIREVLETRRTTISDVFTAVQGYRTVAVHVPVFHQSEFKGTIAALVSFDFIAKRNIENITIGESGYAWVISEKGIEISCPVPGHMGKSVRDTCRDFPDILAMANEMMKGREGTATYHFDRIRGEHIEKVIKHAVYQPIRLGNTFWSIVIATPEDEVMNYLWGLRLKLVLIIIILLALTIAFTFSLVKSQIVMNEQEKRNAVAQALEESERTYRTLVETTNTGYVIIDDKGCVIDANHAYIRLTGRSDLQEILGRSVLEWTAAHEKDKNEEAVRNCFRHGYVRNLEIDYENSTGGIVPVEINAHVVEMGGSRRILTLCRDISDRKKLEIQLSQARRMESIGTLAGGIAHDFNNLLTGILGNVSLALMSVDGSNPLHERLKNIEEYSKRGADLTKQLLGFARGGMYEVKATNLGDFIRKSSEMFGRTKKEVRIHHKVQEGLWSAEVDRGQMDQVFLNLYVNAWQAMSGGGDLYLSAENVELGEMEVKPYDASPGRYVKVTLTDTGMGMDEETRTRIFEPFFTTKERGRGTGLGLASVYGIVKNHGGFVTVESEKNIGTTFTIFLPASTKAVEEDHSTRDDLRTGQETILLIDDEKMILDVGSQMLESLGYTVMTAMGGRPGVQVYEKDRDRIDLVILDMIMPDLGGKETFEALHRIKGSVRVILSSGYSLDGQAKEIMRSGCMGFIQKPFNMEELSTRIRDVLDAQ